MCLCSFAVQFGEKWYSAHCTQKCECKEKHGKGELKCKNKECDGDEVCLMSEQGEYSCKSAGKNPP